MHSANLDHLFPHNLEVLMDREEALRDFIREPVSFYLWRPCTVRVLIVVDGLDFSPSNGFGLSQFVTTILNTGWSVRFAITLADIRNVNVAAQGMMPGEPRIADRIAGFRFDNTDHFAPDRFDVVFLFGIAETYQFFPGRGQATLTDAELQAIGEFQNRGGGLFATGDHAALGRALCSRVARARSMRLWDSKNNALGEDMVSMTGRYRNDTNRIGHDSTSEFNDQSDDIPQQIDPVFYTRRSFIFRYRFPHPLLCGPRGVIRVMPDHPHEGECIVPPDTSLNVQFTGKLGAEYPPGAGGGAQPFPEIISYNRVPAGNVASVDPDRLTDDKSPTVGPRFPGISAYDGHRAGIGRVVCDSTWHHFVNINLTGEANAQPPGNPKRFGFLASASGQAAYEDVKAYFRNLAVWLAPAERIRCMNSRLLWTLVWHEHVLESVLTARMVGLERVSARTLSLIGKHARDALGRYASQCQSAKIIIDLIEVNDPLIPWIDPWRPRLEKEPDLDDDELPMFDGKPMLDAALGGALVAIADQYPEPSPEAIEKLDSDEVAEVARRGAGIALERAQKSLRAGLKRLDKSFLADRGKRAR